MRKEGDKEEQKPNLEEAVDTFMELLPEMIMDNYGRWVIFRNEDKEPHRGYWDSEKDALKIAVADFGITTPYLIRQVTDEYLLYGKHGKSVPILAEA